jgi:protein-glutamine gamma-glutamyltransferase
MGIMAATSATDAQGADMIIPAAMIAATALMLPPLHSQAWWLILPSLICLILRWQSLAVLLLLAAISYADTWLAGGYFLVLSQLWLMRMHSNRGAGAFSRLRSVLQQMLLALPIMLVLFLLLAAAGTRWTDRGPSGRAATGVSDTMTPGSISELVNDNATAMRVRFLNDSQAAVLQPSELYWRGLVLEDFDGHSWSRNSRLQFDLEAVPTDIPRDQRLSYLVTLEPTRQSWLYGLHQAYAERAQTYRDERGMLISTDLIRQRVRYPVTSVPPPVVRSLDMAIRERNLALPANSNPQTRRWLNDLRPQFADDKELTRTLMQHFSTEAFYYTLTPALSSEHSVDDLLFNTREGYCEHYASALTFMLRASGIPSRVVAGYLGGEFNPLTGHWTVAQANAHAWVEAWYPEQGWLRLDPTTQISPERIRPDTRPGSTAVPGYQQIRQISEALLYGWHLSMYDNDGNLRTAELNLWLESRGLGNLPLWLLAAVLLAVGARAMWGGQRPRQDLSPTMRAYLRLDARLRKQGLGREPGETIAGHLYRVGNTLSADRSNWQRLAESVSAAEYSGVDGIRLEDEILVLMRKISTVRQLAS